MALIMSGGPLFCQAMLESSNPSVQENQGSLRPKEEFLMKTHTQPYIPPVWTDSLSQRPQHIVPLAQSPTPLRPWRLSALEGVCDLWIKRDDATGIAVSGNKIRKLEFLLADALEQGCDVILTCGGIQSNHCRSTAVAARQCGLDSVLFLRTEQPEVDPGFAGNLLLDQLVGADIQLISYEQYRNRYKVMEEYAEKLRQEGRQPYIVPEGGSNGLGSWGYIAFVQELLLQMEQEGVVFDDLIVACGSGGTAAGISLAAHLSQAPFRVHAVNVCDDAEYFYNEVNRIYKELGFEGKAEDLLDMIDGYKGLGYAKSRREELDWMLDISRETGVILDPVYSGKAMYGLREESRSSSRFQGKRWLFVHTGGLFGMFDKLDQLGPLLQEKESSNAE